MAQDEPEVSLPDSLRDSLQHKHLHAFQSIQAAQSQASQKHQQHQISYASFVRDRFENHLQNYYVSQNFTKMSSKIKAKKAKESRGQLIKFDKADKFTQDGLTGSRNTEWDKWKKFNAAVPITKKGSH